MLWLKVNNSVRALSLAVLLTISLSLFKREIRVSSIYLNSYDKFIENITPNKFEVGYYYIK